MPKNLCQGFLVAIYNRTKGEILEKQQVAHGDLRRRSWNEVMPLNDDGVKGSPGSCMEKRKEDLAGGERGRMTDYCSRVQAAILISF